MGRTAPEPRLPVALALVGAGPEARHWLAALESAGIAVRASESENASGLAPVLRDPLDLVLVWDDAAGARALSVLAAAAREGSEVAVAVVVHPEAEAAARAAQEEGAAALLARAPPERLPATLKRILRGARLETRSELTGRIAHDLNNRLAPIPLAVKLLRRAAGRPPDPGQLDAVELATRGSMAAVRELSELLAAPPEAAVRIRAKHLLALAARSWRRPPAASAAAPAGVIADYPPDLAAVTVDAVRLLQVLWCLARRALDGAAGGELCFRGRNLEPTRVPGAAASGPAVELRVVCGVAGVDLGAGPVASPRQGGTDELAAVRAVVEAHGGSLRALAAAPDGRGYSVVLPVSAGGSARGSGERPGSGRRPPGRRAPAEPGPASVARPRAAVRTAPPAVLVIDGDEAVRRRVREGLESFGFEVLTAADGAEGIAIYAARSGGVAAALVDLSLLYMDGPATIKALRRIDPGVPMILAAPADWEPQRAGREGGPDAILTKPYRLEELLETLREVTRG